MAGLDSFQIVLGTLLFKVFQFRNLVKGSVNALYCKNVSQTLNELTSSSLLESHLSSYLLRLQTTVKRNKVDYIKTDFVMCVNHGVSIYSTSGKTPNCKTLLDTSLKTHIISYV